MRLYIGVIAAKELFCPLDGYILHNVHTLAAAVITLPRIAFGVFIRKDGTHGRHYRLGNYIFRSYELQVPPLSFGLCFYCLAYLRIILCYEIHDLIYHFIFLLINVKLKIKKPHYICGSGKLSGKNQKKHLPALSFGLRDSITDALWQTGSYTFGTQLRDSPESPPHSVSFLKTALHL